MKDIQVAKIILSGVVQIYLNHLSCFPWLHSTVKTSAVQVSDVQYVRLNGSSADDEAIVLHCSESTPCTNITLATINIEAANPEDQAKASCFNAQGTKNGTVIPAVPCLH